MNSRCRDQVEAAVAATAIDPESKPFWLGRPIPTSASEAGGTSVVRNLTFVLYQSFYCRGGRPVVDTAPIRSGTGQRRHLLESLAASVPDRLRWEDGWSVREGEAGAVVVQKDGLRIWARGEEWRPDVPGDVGPSSKGRLRVPADKWDASAGFLLVEGHLVPSADHGVSRLRMYFNPDARGAHQLLEATRDWNRAGLPFVFKMLAEPRSQDRCDRAILIIEEEDAESASERVLRWIHTRVVGLRSATPAFTHPVIPGVSIAADPPDGGSFGMLRCLQLAEGIMRAHHQGARSLSERMEVIEVRFAEAGCSVDTLHLRDGSGVERPRGVHNRHVNRFL